MAGVASNLYRVDDFASDAVVLELASAKSIDKVIQRCQDSDRDSLNATILSLLFLRMFIVVSSGTDFPRAQGITVLWTCLLFFTSMRMSVVTKRNFVGAVLPIICLYAQRKVKKMGRTTSEPAEHFFGGCRMRKREFTCGDFLNMVDALEISLQKVVEHQFRDETSKKGYVHGFCSFLRGFAWKPRRLPAAPAALVIQCLELETKIFMELMWTTSTQ